MDKRMEPWESPNSPWKNSTQFFTYLRGCLRKAWSRHPTRIAVVNKNRKQIDNPGRGYKKTVWGFECCLCHREYTIKEAQVDHIVPAGSLQKTSDIQGFVERLLYVTEDDLRLVCKGCNSALAYHDKQGVSFELAVATKKAIQMEKDKTILAFLQEQDTIPEKNAKARRQQAINIIMSEEK